MAFLKGHKARSAPPSPEGGFTLVEMAVSTIVIGLVTAGLIVPYNMYQRNKQIAYNEQVMQSANSAIAAFKERTGAYPCPADPALIPGAANFGRGNCAGGAVLVGTLPVFDLNLPYQAMADVYNMKLTYAVTRALTNNDPADDDTSASGPGQVQVRNGNVAALPLATARHSHYILLSHGPNRRGAVGLSSVAAGIACAGGNLEDENCDGDDTFVDANAVTIEGPTYFDDTLVYTLPPQENSAWMEQANDTGMAALGGTIMVNRNMAGVGIGEDDPEEMLHITAPAGTALRVDGPGVGGSIRARDTVEAQRARSKGFFYCSGGTDCD